MDKPLSGELERIDFGDPVIQKFYTFLSKKSKEAFQDTYLLANAVYSKSDLSLKKLDSYISGRELKKLSLFFKIRKLLRYFCKSFGWLLLRILQGWVCQFSGYEFNPDSSKQLTIIDIWVMPSRIVDDQDLVDHCFPGLEDRLKSKRMNYAYVPKFFGSEALQLFYQIFGLLKKKKRPVLFDMQLLGVVDYRKMLQFIFIYPFRVLKQINQGGNSREERLLKSLLWEAMDHTAVKKYTRQLFGKRVAQLNVPSIKCVSWFENQSQDKNFFKGLKAIQGKVSIYGAQLYQWPGTLLNHYVDESQIELGFMPDHILVCGTYYLRGEGFLNYKVGPSMRYARLFETKVNAKNKNSLLFLLPIFDYEINKMLEIIQDASLSQEILIKFHPDTDSNKFSKNLEGNVKVVEGDIYGFFSQVECVIGKATGALVEAASLGIPVINIETGSELSHNYLPRFGKGIIWGSASTGAELVEWVNKFHDFLSTNPTKINHMADRYKKMFFCKPNDERIDEAFGLIKSD